MMSPVDGIGILVGLVVKTRDRARGYLGSGYIKMG